MWDFSLIFFEHCFQEFVGKGFTRADDIFVDMRFFVGLGLVIGPGVESGLKREVFSVRVVEVRFEIRFVHLQIKYKQITM